MNSIISLLAGIFSTLCLVSRLNKLADHFDPLRRSWRAQPLAKERATATTICVTCSWQYAP